MEGIVFQVNTVRGDISREHSVQIVLLVICVGKEIFGKVPKPLRKLGIDREVKALQWEVLICSFLRTLIFELFNEHVLAVGFRVRWAGLATYCILSRTDTMISVYWERISKLLVSEVRAG